MIENTKPRGRLLKLISWIGLIILAGCLLAALGLDIAGLRVGSEADYFASLVNTADPVPTLDPQTKSPLPGTLITIWFLNGPRFFSADTIFAEELSRGWTDEGRLAYYIAFDEEGFNHYMTYWFLPGSDDLAGIYEDIKNPRIDLLPGGLVLYVDLKVGAEWKPAGLIYDLDQTGTQLNFRGISMDGSVFTSLPGSPIDENVGNLIERLSNRALRELTFIDEQSGEQFTIRQIFIDDDRAEVLAVADDGGSPTATASPAPTATESLTEEPTPTETETPEPLPTVLPSDQGSATP